MISAAHMLGGWDYFRHPQISRKEMDNIFLLFCVHFRKLFVEFVVLLAKTRPKMLNSAATAKCWKLQMAVSPFHPKK